MAETYMAEKLMDELDEVLFLISICMQTLPVK